VTKDGMRLAFILGSSTRIIAPSLMARGVPTAYFAANWMTGKDKVCVLS